MQKISAFILAIAIISGALLLMEKSLQPIRTEENPTAEQRTNNSETTEPNYAKEQPESAPTADSDNIHKCTNNGKTTYSDAPCPKGTQSTTVEMHHAAGIVSPDKATIEATRERIRAEIRNDTSRSAIIQMPQPDKFTCDALKAHADQLDELSTNRMSGKAQEQIRLEKEQIRTKQYRLKCN